MGGFKVSNMRFILFACLLVAASAYTWDSCGTKLDRLKTSKVSVDGSLTAGSKVTVTASGATDLHVPLDTGAWQVRIYELGVAKSTHTEFGDLTKALKFEDAKNTTFSMTVSFTLPKKQASGKFNANLVAVDQAKADYMCVDVKYNYPAINAMFAKVGSPAHCTKDSQCPSSYCQNPGAGGVCHGCGDACCLHDSDCPGSYCVNDPTKMPPYTCHDKPTLLMGAAPPAPVCLHQEDTEDHKCFEACAASSFKTKGITKTGKCPAAYTTTDKIEKVLQCTDGVTNVRYCAAEGEKAINVTITTKGMSKAENLAMVAPISSAYTWDTCGTKLDRLKTSKVSVDGSLTAGSKVTVTASGATDLHVPLVTGAWQVRIYELGVAKSTHTEFGDLTKAIKFNNPPTEFKLTVSFTLPKKQASGKFTANLVAVDQAKADYMCIDVLYNFATAAMVEEATATTTLYTIQSPPDCAQVNVPSQYAKQAEAFDKNLKEGTCASIGYTQADGTVTKTVPVLGKLTINKFVKPSLVSSLFDGVSVYCMNDPTKKPPFYCHVPPLPTSCKTNADCVTPWYNSWCMNDKSKTPPYTCKLELPPKCKVDKDCERN